ncbi:amino acid adenylation domain-containing protein [Microcoleus sp. C2C3]|uniref:amino acid adenylation domain-containing protein n=1 Tax=unclassified Microcoleus TaxID=2642155 RepID=UPI002FD7014B
MSNFAESNSLDPKQLAKTGEDIWQAIRTIIDLQNQAPALMPVPRDEHLPLCFSQERLWFLYQLQSDRSIYNVSFAFRVQGLLNISALEHSLNEIIRRHEALRTTFLASKNKPVQVIAPSLNLTLPVVDLQELCEREQETQVLLLVKNEVQQPFDLEQGSLLRSSLVQLGKNEHVLLLSVHHIAFDGWSEGVLWRELTALYTAFSTLRPSPLPELPIQYADFAVWQRQWLQGEVMDTQLDYWKQQLAGSPPLLELPTDRVRPPIQTNRGGIKHFGLDYHLTQKLKSLSEKSGATLFMTLLTGFVVLLSRYSNQQDILIGSPIANRNRSEIESVIGFFVNILVLRTDVSGNPSFWELLQRVRQVALNAYAHQDVPFEQVVEALQPERNLSYSPLFQVMFVLQNTPPGKLELSGLSITPLEVENPTAKYDLTLLMTETEQGLTASLEYNSDLFDRATITRMAGHFVTLLEGIVANPQQRVSELPLLTVPEQHQLLVEWNNTQAEYPLDKCIHQLFEEQVEQTPDAVAVVFADQQLTYRELNNQANKTAHYLQTLGVKPEVLVGICMERSIKMVVALLGILKAGGAYVPLDPGHPQERLKFMLSDSQMSVLLTQEKLVSRLSEKNIDAVCVDTVWGLISQESEHNPISGVKPENLAYVIYTSGSTGRPKGTLIVHQGLVNYLTWATKTYAVDGCGAPVNSSIGFDATITSLLSPLLVGQKVVLLPEEQEIEALSAALRSYSDFSLVKITPAHLDILSQLLVNNEVEGQTRALIVGGEALSGKSLSFWRSYAPSTRLINEYGPTETVVGCCVYEVTEQTSLSAWVPIGRPIFNTQLYILDRYLQLVPVGVPGELHIGGVGLARGYLNRPELTEAKFIPNPFSQEEGARLYKTGDLARYLADGNIEFLGRIDHQVKIRGFRIELEEIETVLSQHPDLREVVVITRSDQPDNPRLVAYFVPHQAQAPTPSTLRNFLKQQLPDYMLPSAFVSLEAIPLTPNGKVDRNALPAPDASSLSQSMGFVPPRTPTQEVLGGIWAEVLGLEQIGIYDNFFELGGHSLLATQVISRLRQAFGVELPLRCLFESPAIAQLSESIEAARHNGHSPIAFPIQPVFRSEELPLSFAQARLWFLDQLEPGSSIYNIPFAVSVNGFLHLAALEMALHEICRRHEVLRTTFPIVNGSPVQAIASTPNLTLSVIDLQQSEQEQSHTVRRLIAEEAQRPFNLSKPPLVRVTLLRLGETSHVLLVVMHHIISDGWSIAIFMRELSALYEAFSQGVPSLQGTTPAPLPELPIQYADFAVWQRQWLQGEVLETQLNYWKQQLAGAPPLLELATDRPRPPVQTFRGGSESFELNHHLTQQLKRLSQQSGATLFMTLLTGFAILLSRYSNQEDIVVGTPIANRNRSEVESVIGFFVNTLILRTDLSGNPSFEELLNRVRQVALDAYAYQDVPFEQLVEVLQPERSLSHNPLFQVMFILQNAPLGKLELPDLSLTPLEINNVTVKFDLILLMSETKDGLTGVLEYNSDLFEATTIRRMVEHLQILLAGIVTNPEQRIWELPLLSAAERHQLLVEWSDRQTTEYPYKLVPQWFEAQVERNPNAVAVVFEGQQLTYRELNCHANKIAHYLQTLGVGTEVLVGICVERSLLMAAVILGILKAGGAFVPLDPTYPQERLAYMLNESQASVLLTQQQLVERLPASGAKVVCLDSISEAIAQENEENPVSKVTSENLAYVIFTSGSTGKPKGILMTHEGVVSRVDRTQKVHNFTSDDRILQLGNISFDMFVWELFIPLLTGARIVIGNPQRTSDFDDLIKLIDREQVTIARFVPPMLQTLLDQKEFASCKSIRRVITGGDKLTVSLMETFIRHTKAELYNQYGPTERPSSITWCCEKGSGKTSIPIGKPLPNTEVYILDKVGNLVPVGVAGELHIGGCGLARGYLNNPDLTAKKFIQNPFNSKLGSRLYKTGDLVRYLPDSNLEFVGRIDNQIKIRGFRIELEEIETVLSQHLDIQEVVVILCEDQPDNPRLVAYFVPQKGQVPAPSTLRSFLKQKLPDYMLPSAFVSLEALPLTPNGKVNRHALPAPDASSLSESTRFVLPHTPTQKILAAIWMEVLRLERVSIHDNFFELGGHSLLATQVFSRLRQAFAIELPLRSLFEFPTLAELAERIDKIDSIVKRLQANSIEMSGNREEVEL